MDCFVVSLLAMTNGGRVVVYGLLFTRNDSTHTPSLRGLEKPVAISVWDTGMVKQNSSLQEFRTCGNLSMGYNY